MVPKGPRMYKFKSIYFQIQREKGKELLKCYFYLLISFVVIKDSALVIRAVHTQN